MNNLNYYIDCFSSLNTMKKCGKPAPHKALLLLSVIDLVERGVITDNRVVLSEEMERAFKQNTLKYLGESTLFQPKINYPFWHMRSEIFWELISPMGCHVNELPGYGLATLKKEIAYARIDKELFELLQHSNARAKLRVVLISTYLADQPTVG